MKSTFMAARRLTIALLLAGAVGAAAWAHPGHGKSISKEEAVQRANLEIARLVESAKLDGSWAVEAKLQTAELRAKGPAKEWALVFANEKVSEADKKTLYVFLSETGEYLAANFTGR